MIKIPEVLINYIAVVVAALLSMAVGFLWYSPMFFGKQWIKFSKTDVSNMNHAKSMMLKTYGISMLSSFFMAFVLAHFVQYALATTAFQGATVGFWAWLGFVVTTMVNVVLYDNKSWMLFAINAGYQLVVLLMMGAILVVWI